MAEALTAHPADAAPRLLGASLRHETPDGTVVVRITEVEAYGAADDPGSHAHRGRTARNASMFEAPGTLYCYLIYGMHVCANVAAGPAPGEPGAVLLRAGEVVEGLEVARSRRTTRAGRTPRDRDLARGPANLCRALALDLTHDGHRLDAGTPTLTIGDRPAAGEVASGPRVGLRAAAERPWRWWLVDDPTVSQYRPAAPLRPRERP
ncbi:DNA-3-methyladenine glycosylase [Nocardioidaceae bacterium]|nr:DNA-3-methyladenine glycosylase [Nocardioidaceae bacterium]